MGIYQRGRSSWLAFRAESAPAPALIARDGARAWTALSSYAVGQDVLLLPCLHLLAQTASIASVAALFVFRGTFFLRALDHDVAVLSEATEGRPPLLSRRRV